MSIDLELEEGIPSSPPPPLCSHKLDGCSGLESTTGLLKDHVDLESGSKRRAQTMAVVGMVVVLVAGVVKRYPALSGGVAAIIVLVFFLYSAIIAFIIFIGAALSVLYNASDQALYCPDFPPDARHCVLLPSSVGLPSENLRLYAGTARLHAVFIGQPDSVVRRQAVTMLYLHGNAGNMGHRLSNVCGLFSRLKVNILLLEYRGFGFSSGRPSEPGLYQDAAAALTYLHTRQDIDPAKIVVFGRSLGGGVGIEMASRAEARRQMAAVIVENTFTSIPDMARALLPRHTALTNLPLCCYKNQFLSRLKMLRIVVPTLVISGLRDTLVPPVMPLQLHQACAAKHKRLVRFTHGTHNDTWRCPGYYPALKYFLDELSSPGPTAPPVFPPGVTWIADSSQLL